MANSSPNRIRHSIRPLSVFSFCGQPIAAPRDEYHMSTKDLPPCTECQRARERAQQMLGGKHRRPEIRIDRAEGLRAGGPAASGL